MRNLLFICLCLLPLLVCGQAPGREVVSQEQLWVGYMTSARFSEKLSVWNDFHFVPQGFFVLRTGLSVHLPHQLTLTGGYAYLGLPAGVTKDLKRPEHRPWGQAVITAPLPANGQFLFRLRYDARFRHNIAAGELQSGYMFNHRIRFLVNYRKSFPALKVGGWLPFLAIGNEVHLNAGNGRRLSPLDQNRVMLMVGADSPVLQVQAGYMNRSVPLPDGQTTIANHTAVLWITHRFDLRKKSSAADAE